MVLLSIIIPVLDDFEALRTLLAMLPAAPAQEVIVVDGGCDKELDTLTQARPDVRIVHTATGRACQMNAGASVAAGRWLLFLHADSQLAPDWRLVIDTADRDASIAGGWYRLRLDATVWQARVIERLAQLRVALFGLAYGDQGIFVRRSVFASLGGYREMPLMEDVDFVRRLAAAGTLLRSSLVIRASPRRWLRDGWFRRSTRNLTLLVLYLAGVSPARLARWY